jgi:hypothetical protein
MARRHLFVAVVPTAFGEVLQGRRLAEALVAAGDSVAFVAPSAVMPALAGAPVRRGVLKQFGTRMLDVLLPQLAAQDHYDSVCLVDLAAVALTFGQNLLSLAPVRAIANVVALDLWSLAETERVFDFGQRHSQLPEEVLAFPRLVPVPFARPEADGGYNAWAPNRPLSPDERARVRERFGVSGERVLVMPTAAWQAPDRHDDPRARELARQVPPVLMARVARSGATLVHVGPAPWAEPSPRYRHLAQLPPADFQDLVGAADAVLTANLSATTIATALAAEVPVVAVTSPQFRVWPLGYVKLLGPVLADNPMMSCVREVDIGDEHGFLAALEPDASWRPRLTAYRDRVHALPSPAARYTQLTTKRRS